jgi:UDP:flavonoid glycosyltransferase YjiC (YdhE family)
MPSSIRATADGKARRVLIFGTSGSGGDLWPIVAIANGLRIRGHNVVAFGDACVASAMAEAGVECLIADPEHDLAAQYEAIARGAAHLDPVAQTQEIRRRLANWSERLGPAIVRAIERLRPDLIVTSLFGCAAVQPTAVRHSLPWVGINSTFYLGPRPSRSPEADFGTRASLLGDYLAVHLNRANLVIHASDREFDFGFRSLPPHHHYVGPLLWNCPAASPARIEKTGRPWVLVTLSTHLQDDMPIAHLALRALSDCPVQILLTIGDHPAKDLYPLPSNARIERYFPHDSVMPLAALMISHAGHGSVMRAFWHGLPMILVPWGRDQRGVAARAERLGVAAVVPRELFTEERLATAVREMIGNYAVREKLAAISKRLQECDSVGLACSLIVRV